MNPTTTRTTRAADKVFERRFTVHAPIERVRAFHARAGALRQLTPAPIRIDTDPSLVEGAAVRFTLYVPWPVPWLGRYENVRDDGFDDVMEEGPFARWRHEHRYRSLGPDQTEVLDRVTAAFREPASRMIWAGMTPAFAYRAWATRRACERKGDRERLPEGAP